jgi:hypothetical protein
MVPAMRLDQFLHQSKADPAALDGTSARALDAPEAIEQMRQFFGRYPGTGVAYRHFRAIRASAEVRVSTTISPSKVNLKAFDSRFRMIFSHMSRST